MKQFKAEWQYNVIEHENPALTTSSVSMPATIDHILTQHNALCDYLEERVILEAKNWLEKEKSRLAEKEAQLTCTFCGGVCVCCSTGGNSGSQGDGPLGIKQSTTQTITIPKPEWWDLYFTIHPEASDECRRNITKSRKTYLEALEACSKASGLLFKLED